MPKNAGFRDHESETGKVPLGCGNERIVPSIHDQLGPLSPHESRLRHVPQTGGFATLRMGRVSLSFVRSPHLDRVTSRHNCLCIGLVRCWRRPLTMPRAACAATLQQHRQRFQQWRFLLFANSVRLGRAEPESCSPTLGSTHNRTQLPSAGTRATSTDRIQSLSE